MLFSGQSRTRAHDPSVEGNEGSGIIQTGSQKSWLIFTAHVLQTFDTFRIFSDTFVLYERKPYLRLLKCSFRALNSYEILPMENITLRTDWSVPILQYCIIDAIGSTNNWLSTVEQREESDLSKGAFRSLKFLFQR